MADNVAITAGSGTSVATDDVAGVHYQRVKLVNGTLDATDAISGDASGLNTHPQPATSGGCLPHQIVTAATTNAANIKASAGQVYGVHFYNNADYPVYVKFHNTAGAPTPGAGVVVTVGVQAGQRVDEEFETGLMFTTGIGVTVTKLMPLTDTTAVLANDAVGHIDWK